MKIYIGFETSYEKWNNRSYSLWSLVRQHLKTEKAIVRGPAGPYVSQWIFTALRSSDFSGLFSFCRMYDYFQFVLCSTIDIVAVLRYNDCTKIEED